MNLLSPLQRRKRLRLLGPFLSAGMICHFGYMLLNLVFYNFLRTCFFRKKVLVAHENSNIEITGEIFQCLRPSAWLNDEVILFSYDLSGI